MRVLHIFNEIKYSGAEIMYVNAAQLFQQQGVEMYAFSTGAEIGDFVAEFKAVNIKVFHRPFLNPLKRPLFLYKYFVSTLKFIEDENIDIIHIHRSTVYWFFSLIAFIAGKKSVMTIHNVFQNRALTKPKAILERYTARKLFRLKFQTIGDSVYQNELHYYKNSTVRVNNWFNGKKFFPSASLDEKNEIRKRLNIPIDMFVIISTGGCTHIKNHHDIIKALALVVNEFPCLYLHLGHGKTELEEVDLANSLGVASNIRFLGNQTNVRDYLISSDLYIMSSKFEGLSIASIEAMACRLPSILYNSPGLRDLILNDDNGFLIDPDYKILAEKIVFSRANPNQVTQMGSSAEKFVRTNFNMDESVKKVLAIYNS